jgi:hypothetical protein
LANLLLRYRQLDAKRLRSPVVQLPRYPLVARTSGSPRLAAYVSREGVLTTSANSVAIFNPWQSTLPGCATALRPKVSE